MRGNYSSLLRSLPLPLPPSLPPSLPPYMGFEHVLPVDRRGEGLDAWRHPQVFEEGCITHPVQGQVFLRLREGGREGGREGEGRRRTGESRRRG